MSIDNQQKAMVYLDVVCALIEKEGKLLCVQRSPEMPLPLKWEFPGGKIEEGESPEDALIREINEELNLWIEVRDAMTPSPYRYPNGPSIRLIPFLCSINSGKIRLKEHVQYLWLPPCRLLQLNWAEADLPIVREYVRQSHN